MDTYIFSNLTVADINVVPIPSAFWLFGTALSVVWWPKRRWKTVLSSSCYHWFERMVSAFDHSAPLQFFANMAHWFHLSTTRGASR